MTWMDSFSHHVSSFDRQGLSSGAIKNLDVEFTIMARDIKVPESGSGLEAAAREFGAQRAAAMEAQKG